MPFQLLTTISHQNNHSIRGHGDRWILLIG
jgi:hypothetical protein